MEPDAKVRINAEQDVIAPREAVSKRSARVAMAEDPTPSDELKALAKAAAKLSDAVMDVSLDLSAAATARVASERAARRPDRYEIQKASARHVADARRRLALFEQSARVMREKLPRFEIVATEDGTGASV